MKEKERGKEEGRKGQRGREGEGSQRLYLSLQLSLGLSFQLRNLESRVNHDCAAFHLQNSENLPESDTKSTHTSIFPNLMCSIAIFIEKGGREMRTETKQL